MGGLEPRVTVLTEKLIATGCHTVFHHRYHIVWVTKYRYKVLEGTLRERIPTIIRQVCKELGVQIVSGVLSKEHVHMFVEIPPHIAVSDFVRRVKGRSSHRVQMEFPELQLGSPFLGEGLLLHHQRQHHRRGDTSVSQVS
jgi:REP element-mobilizing transposase RayT